MKEADWMKKVFVVSDIHGHIEHFEEMLSYWNEEDTLAILGDLIDRGPHSFSVIQKVMQLKELHEENVLFIKGNHEDMLLKFLSTPVEKQDHYYRNGGLETLKSFYEALSEDFPENVVEVAQTIQQNFKEMILFLEGSPHYETFGEILLTHAGFNSELADYTQTSNQDFIWIRKHYEKPNLSGLINIFGHTPIKYINEQNDILVMDEGSYIAIDGGCYMTGQLNGLLMQENGEILHTYKVKKEINNSTYD